MNDNDERGQDILVLYGTDKDGEGEVEIEFNNGTAIDGPCLFVSLKVLNVSEGGAKQTLTLIVPAQAGPALLAALLTEDQWEAVVNA
jgi:hypothetical protein